MTTVYTQAALEFPVPLLMADDTTFKLRRDEWWGGVCSYYFGYCMCIGRVSEPFECGVCTYDYKRVEACGWLFSSLYQVFRLVWRDIPGLQLELYMYSIASLGFTSSV